jgi:hypothetical protein
MVSEADEKEKSFKDCIAELEMPHSMDNETLDEIRPNEWVNVGPSIVHCTEIFKEKAISTRLNFCHLRKACDKFFTLTMNRIIEADQQTIAYRNRMTKELAEHNKLADMKLKTHK